ncbi:4Fe-4S cluster-binding domain-containing protein [Clostridium sp. AM58-1XD]
MKKADVVVDGRFVEELKDARLHWKGSSNQRVIDVPKTVHEGKIVIYEE